jgi:steroid 5-alpha reductase family enzyme
MVAKSLLASRQSKRLVERRLGARARNGLYRPLYVVFSTVGGLLLVRKVYQGPHRVLYEARRPLSWVMRAGQVAALALTFQTIRTMGMGFMGIPQLRTFLAGGRPPVEPEAQGPIPEADGELCRRSTFGFTRHPNNWFPMVLFLIEPRMTDKRALFSAMATVHVLAGSVHEEYRLREEYGAAYDRYADKVPFLVARARAARQSGS